MTQTKAELLQTRHQGDIRLGDADSTHYVGLKAPATVASNLVWTLPATDGTSNQFLKTDGSGNLSWATDSATDSTKMPLAGGTFTGATIYNDNVKSIFGTSSDGLEIYHDSSDSWITDTGSGNLYLGSNGSGINLGKGDPSAFEAMIRAYTDGAVELYNNGVKTFETHTNGIKILGPESGSADLYMWADEGDDDGDKWRLQAENGSSGFTLKNSASGSLETNIKAIGDGAVEIFYDNDRKIKTLSTGAQVESATGDCHFYVHAEENNSGSDAIITARVTNTSASGYLMFGDADDVNIGKIRYMHSNNSMLFYTSDTERFRFGGGGQLGIGGGNFGTSGQVLTSGGSGSAASWADAGGGGFASVQYFTSSGTWTKPSGIKIIRVTVLGAGGGGGKSNDYYAYGGNGGGGGGLSQKTIDVTSISSETVTIGASGAGKSSAAAGGAGGSSSFGSHCSASGGSGGSGYIANNSNSGTTGAGIGSSGNINVRGGYGGIGSRGSGYSIGGEGGASPMWGVDCPGGLGGSSGSQATYGSGGAGCASGTSDSGGSGLIVVEEFK